MRVIVDSRWLSSVRALLVPAVLSLSTLSFSSPARAQVPAAQTAYQDVDYQACVVAAEVALSGAGTKSERVEAYKYLGLCRTALGDTDGGREAFRRMVLIDSAAKLPEGLSPRFTSTFKQAAGDKKSALSLEVTDVPPIAGVTQKSVVVALVDTLNLVTQFALMGVDGKIVGAVAKDQSTLIIPETGIASVVALDAAGGVVIETPHPVAPTTAAEETPPPQDLTWLWITLGAAGGALLITGAVVGGVIAFSPPPTATMTTDVTFAAP